MTDFPHRRQKLHVQQLTCKLPKYWFSPGGSKNLYKPLRGLERQKNKGQSNFYGVLLQGIL